MKAVEIFAGAGGLAIGVSNAGFRYVAIVERDGNACSTIRRNQERFVAPVADWPRFESADVAKFDFEGIAQDIDLVTGGPPCQPFSSAGLHNGHRDPRDMFPHLVRAVRTLRPRALLIENVFGLLRGRFEKYFAYVTLQLKFPENRKLPGENWKTHLLRLERLALSGSVEGLCYDVHFQSLNAADFGVPQRRQRVFLVGFRSDLGIEWSFPEPTHSQEALLWDQWISDEYWDRHGIVRRTYTPSEKQRFRIERLRADTEAPASEPWVTIRDAICDLPKPKKYTSEENLLDHAINPGARVYRGHTGSHLDEPAKALKAGMHGTPGGENVLVLPNGRVRYFTIRECARLQTFPEEFRFGGYWINAIKLLGNAVPATLSEMLAKAIRKRLSDNASSGRRQAAQGQSRQKKARALHPFTS